MSQAFINFLPNNKSIPGVFNPSIFKSNALTSSSVSTESLNVTSKSVTNGIDDFGIVDCEDLIIQQSAIFNGSVIANSNCIATTNFVKNQIDNLLGVNVQASLNTLSEINNAINNDPNYANTVASQLVTINNGLSSNTSSISTLNTSFNTLNTKTLNIESLQVVQGTNISSLSASVTTLQNGLNDKANISNPSFMGIVTTPSIVDNGLNVTLSKALNVASINLNNVSLNSTLETHETLISGNTTAITGLNTRMGLAETNINSNTSGISSLNSRVTINESNITSNSSAIAGNTTNITANTSAITGLGNRLDITETNIISNTSAISANTSGISSLDLRVDDVESGLLLKANISDVVKNTTNENINGVKTFSEVPKIGLVNIATVNDIDNRINALINNAPSNLDTLGEISTALSNNQSVVDSITSSMVTLSGNQTITGSKTFNVSPVVPNNAQGDNSSKAANTSYVDTCKADLLDSQLSKTLAASTYQPISGMSSYATTSSLNNYQLVSGMSSYPTLSGNNTFTGLTFTNNDLVTSKLCERFSTATVLSNALTLDYSTLTNNIISTSPSSAANIALSITNIPTNRTAIYDFTFLINVSTNKNFINSISINGVSQTIRYINGSAANTVNASAVLVIENVYVMMTNATVNNVIVSLSSAF